MTRPRFELTVMQKAKGLPLTKQLSLTIDGRLISDSSRCVMGSGTAARFGFDDIGTLAELISGFGRDQALTLGALRDDLPSPVKVVTKRELNGGAAPDVIARASEYITYRPGEPGLALLDYDTKGMPPLLADKITALGGFWRAIVSVLPALETVARIERSSTSAGLYHFASGEQLPGSAGRHVYLAVQDSADIDRFLHALHARCWLDGFGWYMVGEAGQLLERSIVDRVVGGPERLVFEGEPVVVWPLAQDKACRRPIAIAGTLLDTLATCPNPSIVEQDRLKKLKAREAVRLAPQAEAARRAYINERAKEMVSRTGIELQQAAAIIASQCNGILLPHVVLPFDDEDLAGCTVADVLADPDRFVDATLADPLEGPQYGACKAKIMRRSDGALLIHSFAHGGADYTLQFDYTTAEAAIASATGKAAADIWVHCVLVSPSLDAGEVEKLRNLASKTSELGVRTLERMLKEARIEAARQRRQEERARRLAAHRDPRPMIARPLDDAEWLPVMAAINEVLGAVRDAEPPLRDAEDAAAAVRRIQFTSLHSLTSKETNPDEQSSGKPAACPGAARHRQDE